MYFTNMSACSAEQWIRYNLRSDPPFRIGAIFISATSKRGKCFRVRRTSRSVLINSDVDVAMDASDLFSGADNTSFQPALGSNFCIRPQNCVFQNRICADAAVSSHDCAAAQLRARIDNRAIRYALGPFARFDETRFPIFSQNCAVHFEIFRTRRDVEPFSVVHHHAADSGALAYPIADDWNKRDLFARRNPLENRRVPNGDIGEINISSDAVAIADVHDTLIAQSHSGSQTGVTQSERHVVSATVMFVDQGLEIEVG